MNSAQTSRRTFCILLASTAAATATAKSPSPWQSIFDGRTLGGWTGAVDNYEVKDGAIVCKPGQGGNLYYDRQLSDFEVRLEFRLPPGGNNGLAIRAPLGGDAAYQAFCEIQTLDDTHPKYEHLDPRQFHGSAYGMVAAKRGHLLPVGQWNQQRVRVVGTTIQVELNGTQILDADLSQVTDFLAEKQHPGLKRTEGYFGFAGHNDPVAYRNIELQVLST